LFLAPGYVCVLIRPVQIVRPMFIAQGLNDPRVPVGESEQIVKAVR